MGITGFWPCAGPSIKTYTHDQLPELWQQPRQGQQGPVVQHEGARTQQGHGQQDGAQPGQQRRARIALDADQIVVVNRAKSANGVVGALVAAIVRWAGRGMSALVRTTKLSMSMPLVHVDCSSKQPQPQQQRHWHQRHW